jgi:hypothetical protein
MCQCFDSSNNNTIPKNYAPKGERCLRIGSWILFGLILPALCGQYRAIHDVRFDLHAPNQLCNVGHQHG